MVPIAPNAPGVPATSDTQLQIFWNDQNVGTGTFDLERAAQPGGPYTVRATGLTAKIYDDKNLTAATPYCHRIRAKNSAGWSTAPKPAAPPKPSETMGTIAYYIVVTHTDTQLQLQRTAESRKTGNTVNDYTLIPVQQVTWVR